MHPQNDASVAQLVEHLTLNQGVQGSTPCGSTKIKAAVKRLLFFLQHGFMQLKNLLNLLFVFFQSIDFLDFPPDVLRRIKTMHQI